MDNYVITITGYSGSDTILLPIQQFIASSLFCSAIHNHQVLWIIENHNYNHRILRIIAKREYFCASLLTAITINHYSHIFAIVSGQLLQHMRIYLLSFSVQVFPSCHYHHSLHCHHNFHGSSLYTSVALS